MDKLTQAQLNKLAYVDQAIKNLKTEKQKYAIEKKEEAKRLARREELMEEIRNRPKEEKRIFMNTAKWSFRDKFIKESEISEEQKEKEIEFWFINYK